MKDGGVKESFVSHIGTLCKFHLITLLKLKVLYHSLLPLMSSSLIVGIQSFRWQEKEFIFSVFFRSMVMTPRMARTGDLRWIRQRKVALMRAM